MTESGSVFLNVGGTVPDQIKRGKGDPGALVHLSGGNAHAAPSHSWRHVSGFTKINLYSKKHLHN